MSKAAFDKIAAGLNEAALVAPYLAEIERLREALRDNETFVKTWSDEYDAMKAEIERLKAALTPSGATKAAYAGEFTFRVCIGYEEDTEIYDTITVPWTTIKEIMAAILARAALEAKDA